MQSHHNFRMVTCVTFHILRITLFFQISWFLFNFLITKLFPIQNLKKIFIFFFISLWIFEFITKSLLISRIKACFSILINSSSYFHNLAKQIFRIYGMSTNFTLHISRIIFFFTIFILFFWQQNPSLSKNHNIFHFFTLLRTLNFHIFITNLFIF